MPKSEYFEGHGAEVEKSIRKAHPGYSEKRVKAEFYATANKAHGKPGQKVASSKHSGKSRTHKRGSVRVDTYEA